MTQARRHRGGYADSMATVKPCATMAELVELIRADWEGFLGGINPALVHVEPYGGIDERNGWDTYLVFVEGHGVWGMTDGPA